ncbi:MAG: HAD family hydrolase [Pseudomonadales bacterium]|nr:HAD family hydrolase [Pseudomonadales bacterium]
MIRLITLDLDNTLWDVNPVIKNAEKTLVQWLREHIPASLDHYHKDTFIAFRDKVVADNPDLTHLPTTFRKMLLSHCFELAGLSADSIEEATEASFKVFHQARNQIEFYEDTLPLLETLSQDFSLIALSNGNADVQMVGLGNYFAAHFSAESTGKPKPDPTMFTAALNYLDIEPEQAIHIGDHPLEDVEAAKKVGYRTIWFNENHKQDANSCVPDRQVHQLNQIVSAIQDLLD